MGIRVEAIVAKGGGDRLGNRAFAGGGGNDRFELNGGADKVHGGAGQDTVLLYGNQADFTFQKIDDQVHVTGPDGQKTILVDVENVEFMDGTSLAGSDLW